MKIIKMKKKGKDESNLFIYLPKKNRFNTIIKKKIYGTRKNY
jgi:hypothetical protein